MTESTTPPVFVVNGKEYPIPSDFDLGEMCDAEQFFAVDFNDPRDSARDVAALIYIAVRRVDPTVRVEDIRKIPASELQTIMKTLKTSREVDARPPDSAEKPPETSEPPVSGSSSGGDDSETGQNGSGDLSSEEALLVSVPPTSEP